MRGGGGQIKKQLQLLHTKELLSKQGQGGWTEKETATTVDGESNSYDCYIVRTCNLSKDGGGRVDRKCNSHN